MKKSPVLHERRANRHNMNFKFFECQCLDVLLRVDMIKFKLFSNFELLRNQQNSIIKLFLWDFQNFEPSKRFFLKSLQLSTLRKIAQSHKKNSDFFPFFASNQEFIFIFVCTRHFKSTSLPFSSYDSAENAMWSAKTLPRKKKRWSKEMKREPTQVIVKGSRQDAD